MRKVYTLEENKKHLKKVCDEIKAIKKDIGASDNCRDITAFKQVVKHYDNKFWIRNIKKGNKYQKPLERTFFNLLMAKQFLKGCIVTELQRDKKWDLNA